MNAMTKESGRREKVIQLIKELTLELNSEEYKVPTTVSDFILQEYGLSAKTNAENISDSEMNELVSKLEDMIIRKYKRERKDWEEPKGNDTSAENNFMKACETFTKAKNEYIQTSFQLISLLNEINQFKAKYSNHLKEKAASKQDELELMEKKIQLLKGKSLLELYSENNSFAAHLKLMEILTGKLKKLELTYDNLVELDAKYSELKNNKTYCDLLSVYKQLLTREKKLDYMMQN